MRYVLRVTRYALRVTRARARLKTHAMDGARTIFF